MKHDEKQSVALWRLGVLGPLASARLDHGDRRRYFEEAAARTHERPDGTRVQLSARTIEAWYHAHRRGGFQALFPRDREDRGKSRAIGAEIACPEGREHRGVVHNVALDVTGQQNGQCPPDIEADPA